MTRSVARLLVGVGLAAVFCGSVATAQEPRYSLPVPPGIDPESVCGPTDELVDVEFYKGDLGFPVAYVDKHAPSTVQLQWLNMGGLASKVPDHQPGNVAGQRWCTGTLLADNRVLTAGHCFDINEDDEGWVTPFVLKNNVRVFAKPEVLATLMVVNFNYQRSKVTKKIGPERSYPIVALKEYRLGNLDYAIVEFGKGKDGQFPQETPGVVAERAPTKNEAISIIQHPQGEPKQFEGGKVSAVTTQTVSYNDLDTHPGSSGSGIRDKNGLVIGVHTNGGCSTSANPGTAANRGVPVSAIRAVSPIL